ncbi:pyridoxamine 5'-phosphate oxidase family protein [Streptomyces sp. G5(2025)]|uniref:pyridoxamine 5'-phosphate oxidase family protein n=1 Tax=Streptomyces sp. G5(2025) TaxID=3406628 RepID=UPI003C18DA98
MAPHAAAPTPYHPGSRAVQDKAGVRELADHVGRSISQGIRPVAAAFLEIQPQLVIAAADSARAADSTRAADSARAADPTRGAVWASLLTGTPGFVRATGPRQISITATPHATDPLAAALTRETTPVGTLALDPRTRRRMRLNGRSRPAPRGLAIEADQVFANCPKYLQKRTLHEERTPQGGRGPQGGPGAPRHTTRLTDAQRASVAASDTFFLATAHAHGADAGHRGGNPGFVRVTSATTLEWDDYPGNAMFLSLGNLHDDPRAGLLFLDWRTGTTLQLTGTARTDHADDGSRTVRFTLTETVETPSASPWRWSDPEYSPANPALGD